MNAREVLVRLSALRGLSQRLGWVKYGNYVSPGPNVNPLLEYSFQSTTMNTYACLPSLWGPSTWTPNSIPPAHTVPRIGLPTQRKL